MPHDEAVTAPGETPVRDEGHLRSEAVSRDGAGRAQHLAHAGSPTRALPSHHHHVPRAYPASEDRLRRALLALEHTRPSGEALTFLAGDLRHRALGRDVAVEDHEVTVLLQRVRQWAHNVLSAHVHGNVFEILPHSMTGDREAVRMQEPCCEQHLHERLSAV